MTLLTKAAPIANDPRARETQATIVSVSDQDFYITRTYACFTFLRGLRAKRERC
jgi:hypothetical protein